MCAAPIESAVVEAGGGVLPASIPVYFFPSPLRVADRCELEADAGLTVAEILDSLELENPADWPLEISISGYQIPRSMWEHTTPNAGSVVVVQCVPRGGQAGKGVLQVLAGLALLTFAAATFFFPFGPFVYNPIAVSTAWSLVAGGAALIASGAFSLAAPPPAIPFSGEIPSSDSRAIAAARNEVRPFSPVPRVFGRYRIFPQYAAKPYTETVGNDQFLRLLFTFGYGPLQLTDLKIGEDDIETFEGVEWNFLPGYDDDPALALFTNSVDELTLQVAIDVGAGPVTRTTELDTHEATIDLTFPTGLIAFESDSGSPKTATANIVVEYRAAGTSDLWVGVTVSEPLAPGLSNAAPGAIAIAAIARGLLRRGLRVVFPSAGQWEIRISRTATDVDTNSLGTLIDDCTWTSLRSIRPGTPPRVPNLALLEMRIRATDQLSGVVADLSAVVTSILPVWNSIDEWGPANRLSTNGSLQATRSPAWALAEMLRGGVNARPVPDENIDSLGLAQWALDTAAIGRFFDAVVDFDTTVGQVCRDIAASGRASFSITDGRYGIVSDVERPLVVAQFSDRDTANFSATKIFARQIHGMRTRFVNPDAGYEVEELLVYADGYDETNATEFGELDLWGVTDPERAYRDARYHMAAGKLRPELYSFDLDVSQLAITRGDRVIYSHDVLLVGIGSARVVSLLTAPGEVVGVEVDAVIDYDPAIEYAARIRNSGDGSSTLHPLQNLGGEYSQLSFSTPLPDTGPIPAVDDMVTWGKAGRETGDYLVNAIIPTADLGARVELVDYSPAIFDAETETVPPFDPNITDPRPRVAQAPGRPAIESVASDESVLVTAPDGSLTPRIVVRVSASAGDDVPAETLQGQFRTSSPVGDWLDAGQVDARTPSISIDGVDQGVAYDVRVRSVSGDFRASEWATVTAHLVVGSATPPPDVESLRVEPTDLLVWDYPAPPRDFAGFRVRHQAGSDPLWATGIPAHDGLVTESRFDLSGLPGGSRTVLVKAIDAAGNESVGAPFVVHAIGSPELVNVLESRDFHALGFPGTITDATVEGGTGDLVADFEATKFYGGASGKFYGSPSGKFYGGHFKPMAYEGSWTPAPASVPGRLFLTSTITASAYRLFYRIQGSTEWLAWPGVIDAQASTTYEFRVELDGGRVEGRISALSADIDVPDIEEDVENFVVASSGTVRLTLENTYAAIKQVLVTIQDDGNGGASAIVVDKNPTLGPEIQVKDQAGMRVVGLIDAKVKGY